MEKLLSFMTRFRNTNPETDPLHQHKYYELLKVRVLYSNLETKCIVLVDLEKDHDKEDSGALKVEIKFDKRYVRTLYDRVKNLIHALKSRKGTLFLCMTMLDLDDQGFRSTNDYFDKQFDLKNFHVLVDLADTELKNIKAFNSKTLALLEPGELKEMASDEISNQYSSFYKGVTSLLLQVKILSFHLMRGRHTTLLQKFSGSLEGKIRQYEVELETTKLRVFQLMKNKFGDGWLGPRWLPDSWNKAILSAILHRETKNKDDCYPRRNEDACYYGLGYA